MKAWFTTTVLVAVLVLCATDGISANTKVRFDNHQVVRMAIVNDTVRELVAAFNPDVWSHDSTLAIGTVDLRLPKLALQKLSALGVQYEVMIDDVQALIDQQEQTRLANANNGSEFFTDYHDYEEIVYHTKQLVAQYEELATFIPSIGKSIQGRDIIAVHIHGGPFVNNKGKADTPKIWFNGGQHAREWISPMTVMYILTQLLSGYGTDERVTAILNRAEIVIVPVVNPDGLDFTFTGNRLWRKNRRVNAGGSYGVDLNRNWDDHWGGEGSSGVPTSDTYRGTAPFSEPETKAVSNFMLSFNGGFVAAIDFHSYSQLILRPYGWTRTAPPDEAALKAVGDEMRAAILAVDNKAYTNQPSWALYFTTGGASDWHYSKAKVPLSYTIELRDTGRYGFLLPANQIVVTGKENFQAILYLAEAALANN